MRLLGSARLFFHSSVRFSVRPRRTTQFWLNWFLWNFKLRAYWQSMEKVKLHWKSDKDDRSPVDRRMFVSTWFINITMATFAPKFPTLNCFIAILVPCLPRLSCFFKWLDSPSGPRFPHSADLDYHRHTTIGSTPLDKWSARRKRPLPDNTQYSRDTHPCPRRDSNLQRQQASGRKPMI